MELFHNLAIGFRLPSPSRIIFYYLMGFCSHADRRAARHPAWPPLHACCRLRSRSTRLRADHALPDLLRGAVRRLDHRDTGQLPAESSSVVTCLDGYQMAR